MNDLYIEQFNDDDVKYYGMCPGDYGVFDNTCHCYFYGSKAECEAYLIKKYYFVPYYKDYICLYLLLTSSSSSCGLFSFSSSSFNNCSTFSSFSPISMQ